METLVNRLAEALADRYAIGRELGRGGMATVYLAQDLKHDRQVAIKVLKPELGQALGADRFLREIRLTANLQHPHIVALYDSGEADGLLYYVMPYVEGESLRARLDRDARIPVADAVRIARQVATALEFAHARDVVHRDIKPENILLAGGTALVADFGIARATQAASAGQPFTAVGLAVGTPAYMSPEQASGQSDVDGRSDLYALGCVVYEMLAGSPPFGGDTPQRTLARQVVDRAPPLATTGADVPRPLATVVERLLAKVPGDRYATASAFAQALDAAAVSGPQRTVGSGAWWSEVLSRRAVRVVAAYALLGVLALAVLKWWVTRLPLSPHLTGLVGLTLLLFLPTVTLLASRRRADGWSVIEKVGIPANALIAIAVLFLVFGGKDLGAATTAVTLRDEEGNLITRQVPKEGYRKNLAVFFFDNPTADTALTWLQYGIPWAVQHDLLQDLFFYVQDPLSFREWLQREGFPDGRNVPLALKRQIAQDAHLGWLLAGTVDRAGRELTVSTQLYETRSGQVVAKRRFAGSDVFALVDQITMALKADLEVPEAQIEGSRDLPVAETLTASLPAYRHYVDGAVRLLRLETAAAAVPFAAAVAEDSLFALAYVALWQARILSNQADVAPAALERARRLAYKLPEIYQLIIRTYHYRIAQQDPQRALAVARMHTELYPFDLQARSMLAQLWAAAGQFDSAGAEVERMYALDTTRHELLRTLGSLAMQRGDDERTLGYFRRYADRFPEDARAFTDLGQLYARIGDHARALEQYERASLLDAEDVDPILGAAWVLTDIGRFDDARARFDDALAVAETPSERTRVFDALRGFHDRRGEVSLAVRYMERGWAEGAYATVPLALLQLKLEGLAQYVRAGRVEVARDSLAALGRQVSGALDALLAIGRLGIAEELEHADSLEAALPQLDTLIARFGLGVLRGDRERAQGLVWELRGSCERAVSHYEQARALNPTLTATDIDLARCERALGQYGDAQRRLTEYLRRRPYHPRGLYELALVYSRTGKREDAVRLLRQAMEVFQHAEPACVWVRRVREALAELS